MRDGVDRLQVAGLTLEGVTRGGVQTCLMVPELDVMFDVGPLPPGALRYRKILVSHGHQDHLGALPYLVSQRQLMRSPPLQVHLPREIEGPVRTILSCWGEIEGFALLADLVPHDPEDEVELRPDLRARAIRSHHRVPSLAWLLTRSSRRLRPEFVERPGPDLARLRREGVEITTPHREDLLCVTGDTRIDLFHQDARLRQVRVLVHEVTSWDDRRDVAEMRAWGHTHVDEMAAIAEAFEGEALVLVHRSLRHRRSEAREIVQRRFPSAVRDRVHVFGH